MNIIAIKINLSFLLLDRMDSGFLVVEDNLLTLNSVVSGSG